MSQQTPPWDAFGQQHPGQYQGQPQYPQQPYGPGPQDPPPPYPGQRPAGPQHRAPPQRSWPGRHKVLTAVLGVVALFIVGSIGAAAGGGAKTGNAAPAPTVTVTVTEIQHDPGPTVTATVAPTANAQGEATRISDDGVYVVGQDIPGGTWHTSGGSQCYEATLSSTDTSNIINNNCSVTCALVVVFGHQSSIAGVSCGDTV